MLIIVGSSSKTHICSVDLILINIKENKAIMKISK